MRRNSCYTGPATFQAKPGPVGELINLRRAKKAKARARDGAEAEANRIKHGVGKKAHKLAKARADKDARAVDAHKLTDENK